MTPFTKILVPHDFSAHAARAIEVAADMSQRYAASLTLLHVHEPEVRALPEAFMLYRSDELPSVFAHLHRQLEVVRNQALAAGAPRVESQVRAGVVVTEILQYASSGHYDLVVMGTHGRTGLRHALIGSVAERVVRSAPCPVLAVQLRARKIDRAAS